MLYLPQKTVAKQYLYKLHIVKYCINLIFFTTQYCKKFIMRHVNLRALPSGGMTGSVMLSAVETSHWVSTLIGGILRFALNDTREKSFAYNCAPYDRCCNAYCHSKSSCHSERSEESPKTKAKTLLSFRAKRRIRRQVTVECGLIQR